MAITERIRKCDGVRVYVIDFRDQQRHRVREVAGTTRTQAKNLLAKRLGEVKTGDYQNPNDKPKEKPKPVVLTFRKFAGLFLRDYVGKRPRSTYYDDQLRNSGPIIKFFGKLKLTEITEAHLDQFRRRRLDDVGPSTVRKNLTVLGTMLNMAKRWKLIEVNPAADLRKPSEPRHRVRFLSLPEWERLEARAQPWLRPILRMAVFTGMRLGEITGLTWEDVDRKAGVIHVPMDTKSGTRAVPMNETVRKLLEGQVRHLRCPYVFARRDGRQYHSRETRNTISKHTRAAARAVGIHDAGFHSLRHTAASWMVQSGVSLYDVQLILGHSTPAMTARYAHLRPEHLRDSIRALDTYLDKMDVRPSVSS
jgi:integrase